MDKSIEVIHLLLKAAIEGEARQRTEKAALLLLRGLVREIELGRCIAEFGDHDVIASKPSNKPDAKIMRVDADIGSLDKERNIGVRVTIEFFDGSSDCVKSLPGASWADWQKQLVEES